MIRKISKRKLLTGLGLLSVAGMAVADDTTSGYSGLESMDAKQTEQKLQVNSGFTYNSNADFDDGSLGEVSVWRFDMLGRYTLTMEQGELGLGTFYEYSEYDFDDLTGVEKFNTLAFDAVWKSMCTDTWGYFLYGGAGFSADTDASMCDGFTGVGALGARYVHSKSLNFGLGLGVASQLEDDPIILPVIIVNWQINDRWDLRVLNGAVISYDLSGEKRIILDAGVKYQRRQYRLEDDAAVTEKTLSAEVGATYRFSDMFAIRGFVGFTAGRNFTIRQDDDKVADEDVDPSALLGLRGMFTF